MSDYSRLDEYSDHKLELERNRIEQQLEAHTNLLEAIEKRIELRLAKVSDEVTNRVRFAFDTDGDFACPRCESDNHTELGTFYTDDRPNVHRLYANCRRCGWRFQEDR